MKFLSLLIALLTTLISPCSCVDVVQNFLSVKECDEILRQQSLTAPDVSISEGETVGRNAVKVAADIKRRMATAIAHVLSSCKQAGDASEQACVMDPDVDSRLQTYLNSSWAASDDPEIILTTVKKSTKPHVDCWFNPNTGQTEVLNDKVGFVFLDDMQEAYFTHQEGDKVVIPSKGSLVVFDGNVQHNTILNGEAIGDHLHLLGPYTLTNGHGLSLVVGCTPYPKCLNPKKKKSMKEGPMRK